MSQTFPIPGLKNGSYTRGPLADLYTDAGNDGFEDLGTGAYDRGDSVYFPNNLAEIDHWVTFRSFKTERAIRSRQQYEDNQIKTPCSYITLPMPARMSTNYEASYSPEALGIGGKELAVTVPTSLDAGKNMIDDLRTSIAASDAAGTKLSDILASRALAVTGASLVGKMMKSNVAGKVGAALVGIAYNPHNVIMFQDVGFRQHSFNYRFSPLSEDESKKLRTIISLFKYYMSPSYAKAGKDLNDLVSLAGGKAPPDLGDFFYAYPEYFEIDFHHPQYLFNMGPSVLKSFNVDYHPNNTPSYVRPIIDRQSSPAPTEIEISLVFQEVEIVSKDTITKYNR